MNTGSAEQRNVSVNSKPDHLPGDSHIPTAPGWGFRPTFYPGDRGFELEKFFTVDVFQRNMRPFEKQMFLCCFISIFAKTVDVYCIFNNIHHFQPFWPF